MIDVLIIPVLGLAVPMVIVPVALGLRYARYERQMEHAERMKALELGRTLPQDEPWWSPGRICLAIGVIVPIGVFLCAWLASGQGGEHEEALRWTSAAVVAIAGVISGSLLTHRHLIAREQTRSVRVESYAKPSCDADVYDEVGSRV